MRRLQHLGVEWKVKSTDTGRGTGSDYPIAQSTWEVRFEAISNPKRVYLGRVRHRNLDDISEPDLRASLDAAIAFDDDSKG